MKPTSYLYLLAADQDFRLLHGRGSEFVEITHRTADQFPDVEDRQSGGQSLSHAGRQGQSFEVGPQGRKDHIERDRFARHVAQAVAAEWDKGGHDRIVIAAGPKMLGALRDALPKALHSHIAAEVHKDLVKVPVHELPSHFAGTILAV